MAASPARREPDTSDHPVGRRSPATLDLEPGLRLGRYSNPGRGGRLGGSRFDSRTIRPQPSKLPDKGRPMDRQGRRIGEGECPVGAAQRDPGDERRENHPDASQLAERQALRPRADNSNRRRAQPQTESVTLTFAAGTVHEGKQIPRLVPGRLLERPRLVELVKPLGSFLDELDGPVA